MTPCDLIVTPTHLRFLGRRFPCTRGKGGISDRKQEGDGATPRGQHRLVGMLYRPDRLAKHLYSHERLDRADPLYDLVIVTDWNWPYAVKGRGSAIFIHQWRRAGYPTEGCIGLRRTDLHWIAPRIRHHTRLVVL